jgi:hypothetical protein
MKYTESVIRREALIYETRNSFQKYSSGHYQAARRRGILDDVCSHMKVIRNNNHTLKGAKAEALKYTLRGDFQKGSKGTYLWCLRNNHLDEVCSHMARLVRKPIIFSLCEDTALLYNTRKEFQDKDASIYMKAMNKGWLNEICSHMANGLIKYSDDEIIARAKLYDSRSEFEEGDPRGYDLVRNRGLNDVAYSHMSNRIGGFDPTKSAILYYISINDGQAYKIGITNYTVNKRYRRQRGEDLGKIKIIKEWEYIIGKDAHKMEQRILKDYAYAKWTGDDLLANGNSEMFDRDILGLDI